MADVKELILTIVGPLVTEPDQMTVNVIESEDFIEYQLAVAPEDIGRVIGKQGRVAKAIRTIVYSVRTQTKQKIRLTILDQGAKSSE
ncbi:MULTISPECIES: KH domain-containing protein [Enterococcus]|uniref:RNA-binding protein KhpA n=1 Tax=Enterococcus sulfureus ATCC 49903 TaxID=1140003 RepID=S0LDD7_9ENTE|nr:KH domain-containing protein [Enterococcus sulfureus]EOT51335.1 RNA-binding protein [Enterococcus sulfureus ATCC 49903]EOT86992.1 RNA-binding protein [Enterococcus sulfureus ATCC 49903]